MCVEQEVMLPIVVAAVVQVAAALDVEVAALVEFVVRYSFVYSHQTFVATFVEILVVGLDPHTNQRLQVMIESSVAFPPIDLQEFPVVPLLLLVVVHYSH